MVSCEKCGKKLGFADRVNSRQWNAQLQDGYLDITAFFNERHKKMYMKYLHLVERDYKFNVPDFAGKTLCVDCANDLWWSLEFDRRFKEASEQNKLQMVIIDEVSNKEFASNRIKLISEAGQNFGFLFKHESQDYVKNELGGSGLRITLVYEKQQQNKSVQIILDFSSLKDVMSKGGLVMTTYKCPNCNGMVKLPETGKMLVCEYCGTPIKPVDVFEKIKSLIQ